jgi:hypothetical protein
MLLLVVGWDDERYRQEIIAVDIAVKVIREGLVVVAVNAHQGHKELDYIYDAEQKRESHAEVVEYYDKTAYRV